MPCGITLSQPVPRASALAPQPLLGLVIQAWRVFASLMERQRQRRVLAELADAPDYLLQDVGLTRRDVLQELQKPFCWRK